MTLAAIDPIWLIAAAAYGVFAWYSERKQKKALEEEEARNRAEGKKSQTPLRPESTGETSEEERMRKFLEALGVPSGSPPLRPTTPPASLKPTPPAAQVPVPQKPASPTLAPRPVAMPIPRPMQRPKAPKHVPTPPRMAPPPKARPVFHEPEAAESRDPGRLEEPAASVEQISTDFARMHDQRMAIDTLPSIQKAALGSAGTTQVGVKAISAQGLALRQMLRNSEALRAAIVVSEVLGPPKGA